MHEAMMPVVQGKIMLARQRAEDAPAACGEHDQLVCRASQVRHAGRRAGRLKFMMG